MSCIRWKFYEDVLVGFKALSVHMWVFGALLSFSQTASAFLKKKKKAVHTSCLLSTKLHTQQYTTNEQNMRLLWFILFCCLY